MCNRVILFLASFALAFLPLVPPIPAAEKYPDRPIDFICTWGVGGGADQMARTIGKLAEKFLGVALPVSNIPGSSGNSGMANVLAAKADGYTVATYIADTLGTIPAGTARHKITRLRMDRPHSGRPILSVREDGLVRLRPIQDLLKYAKENPGKTEGGRHRVWNRR